MTYKHLIQTKNYQIYALMKAGQKLKTIAQMLGRHKSTIGRGDLRKSGLRGYRPRQADTLCQQRAQASCNSCQIDQRRRVLDTERLNLQGNPGQNTDSLLIRYETIYQHVYAEEASDGVLWKTLSCQQKKRKRYVGGRYRRDQIIGSRPIAQRPTSAEALSQVGRWEKCVSIGRRPKKSLWCSTSEQ